MTASAAALLANPDLVAFVVNEYATEDDLRQFGPYIRELFEAQRYDWERRLRDKQRWPEGDWTTRCRRFLAAFGNGVVAL